MVTKNSMARLATNIAVSVTNATRNKITIKGNTSHPTATAVPMAPGRKVPKKTYEARFLGGTVLIMGAQGPVVDILRERLVELADEGFLTTSPDDDFPNVPLGYRAPSVEETHPIWRCVKEYVDQGISYASKRKYARLVEKSKAGNYAVDECVWRSLGLPFGTCLEDMFKIKSNSTDTTVNLTLKTNTITIDYHPSIYISRNEIVLSDGGEARILLPILPKDDPLLYEDYILQVLKGVLHWKNETPSIHGIKPTIIINLYDVNGKKYVPIWDSNNENLTKSSLTGYDFIATKKSNATIFIEEKTLGIISDMVSEVLTHGWSKDGKLQIHIRKKTKGIDSDDPRRIEHEFGHVLGLFDAYGYGGHIPIIGEIAIPEADIDGVNVCTNSVMLCKWATKYDPWIRTDTDWEMVLLAWQDNKLQCYMDCIMGKQSQAYFH